MPEATKTDNHNPEVKLALRRYFLRKYHAEVPPRVLDCCQGSAKLWTALRSEFTIGHYWGMDLKPKKGRLKLDSVRYLDQPGWPEDLIDIDTYGSPWNHWEAMLKHVTKPLTVFLTLGQVATGGGGGAGQAAVAAAGLVFPTLKVPPAFEMKLRDLFPRYCLAAAASRFGVRIVEAMEAVNKGNARYFGVRIEPQS